MDADSRMDKTFFRIGKLTEQGNDFDFWQGQPYEKRLATIEAILQIVYRVVKQK